MRNVMPVNPIRQAAILVGGKGTRLGEATRFTPKPLMQIDTGLVFLDLLLDQLSRQGFDDILLLAGHFAEQFSQRYASGRFGTARVRILVEEQPLGTGGALVQARAQLAPRFLMLNGDSYFDINLRAFAAQANVQGTPGMMALRAVEDARRFGTVELDGARVTRFQEKSPALGRALINAGIYALDRALVETLPEGPASIENEVFPRLAAEGRLSGTRCEGYFIDIGLPDTLEAARVELPGVHRRPAAFLDRDGVVNQDRGYTHRPEDLVFVDGAPEAIRALNDAGFRVIVVSNQAGVARGFYSEEAVEVFHRAISDQLARRGAFIDHFYYCPFHPEGTVERYARAHGDRKPEPGMLLKAFEAFAIDRERSFLVGDMATDVEAARRAGISGYLFEGADLARFMATIPQARAAFAAQEAVCP